MAAPTSTGSTAVKIAKPKYILVQPWQSATSKGTGKIYSFADVLRDSTSLTQDDPEVNNIENELSDDPIRTNVTLGTRTFQTTLEDIQTDMVVEMAGFTKDSTSGKVYAPASYTDKFAEVTIVLDKGNDAYVGIILPKVQLNTKMILESLSTSMVGLQIGGTALATEVTDGAKKYTTGQYIDYSYTLPS